MLKQFFGILITLALAAPATAAQAATPLTQQQTDFLAAEKALAAGKRQDYQQLRQKLDSYPLAVYLDYDARVDHWLQLPATKLSPELELVKDTPLLARARHRYLRRAGTERRWQDFLALSPNLPKDVVLQCNFYQAQLHQGDKQVAFQGARELWLYGYSRPKECDPLFAAWVKAGHRTQEMIWQRMFLAFEAGEGSLLSFLAKKVTRHHKEAQRLLDIYRDPRNLRHLERWQDKAQVTADMVAAGLRRLSYRDLKEAVSLFQRYENAKRFNPLTSRQLQRHLSRRILLRQELELQSFADALLPQLVSDDLVEMRLRWALRDNDPEALKRFLPLLSSEGAAEPRWQYWLAVNTEDKTESNRLLSELVKQRSFYGFRAAALLNQNINLEDIPTAAAEPEADLDGTPALARITELLALGRLQEARSEWLLLLGRQSQERQGHFGRLAMDRGWDFLAVDASIQAKLWDDMAMRFPTAELKQFERHAKGQGVDIAELMAIARRESAFYPLANSSVGARGLMQLMPATAAQTAKRHNIRYQRIEQLYDPSTNIALGSAYYNSLLKRYKNNRIFATAAYNAGPERVDAWRKRTKGELDAMAFIESIPFRETREYVQAVFSYRMIYQHRSGKDTPLFSTVELQSGY
ncbi:transglycosylase SLT domain-containing protein [Shewanella sedimentimangrovi]|uniref:Transglycosylase SLT domain-containing protein n=1 Tax=Shewanella sedimentimangrovi TaxID=2814293 RepID=A0ABX7R6T4_9GAMM|nr:transglycosylase SLT domain-containing protein [Shewanella sedimentimangrovi]QSX38788.1 transglycosylase SLT domain-containing protein [Shewanella sedimentimangrovi]